MAHSELLDEQFVVNMMKNMHELTIREKILSKDLVKFQQAFKEFPKGTGQDVGILLKRRTRKEVSYRCVARAYFLESCGSQQWTDPN